jgi:hypothetical protein
MGKGRKVKARNMVVVVMMERSAKAGYHRDRRKDRHPKHKKKMTDF